MLIPRWRHHQHKHILMDVFNLLALVGGTSSLAFLGLDGSPDGLPPMCVHENAQDEFKKEMPCISNCMVIGDKRKFLSILIALRVEVSGLVVR